MTLELHLGKLEQKTERRLLRLSQILDGAPLASDAQDRRVAFVTIEAQNTWMEFCRFFFLGCALGGKDASGQRMVPAVGRYSTVNDALTFAIHEVNPKLRGKTGPWSPRDEPTWHQAGEFSKIMRALNTSNVPNVVSAVSLAPAALKHLPTFRNFYAHRSEHSAKRAQKLATDYVVSTQLHPTKILLSYAPGRPRPILREWLDDLVVVVRLMS